MPPDESWESYQRLILTSLDDNKRAIGEILHELADLKEQVAAFKLEVNNEISAIKGKVAAWSAFVGIISAGIFSFLGNVIHFK